MAHLLIVHDVEDYAQWRTIFERHDDMRQASGCEAYQLFRDADNPNHVVILFEWDSVANARQFAESDDLRQAMQKAGVVSRPQAYFLNEDYS
ncbi:MAG: antibiotic biosynthesis monooxygenase [Anaerolineae bacterium]|nr:antibiotic biosynthesis monooxygenase [Anaerolineae bacterium]